MANETNDLKRILILVLIAIPAIASVNINCNGKAFHCVNSTHFMICVDLGGGLSTTIDDFVIPCPTTTVCQRNNIFECEFPKIEETLPLHVIGVEKQSDISEPTLVTNSVNDPTPTSDTVSVFNDTILTTARPEEDLVSNATVVENNNETTGANNDNISVINFQTTPNIIDSVNEINGKQSNNKPNDSLRTISVTDKNSSEIDVKNATNSSSTDNSNSADTTTTTIECIISKPTTDLSSVRTAPTTDVFTSSDNLDENNSTTDKLNTPSQIVSSDIAILSSEVNAPVVNTYNKTSIQTVLASQDAMTLNTERNTTKKLLVDNHANTAPHADVLISLDVLHQNITTVIASPRDPPRDSIASNVNNTNINNLTENISDSKTFISTGRPIADTEVNIARTTVTNNDIDIQNSINEYSTTSSPLDIINTVHSKATETNNLPSEIIPADSNTQTTDNGFTYLEKVDSNVNDSQYVASTSLPIGVSNSQNKLNENITLINIPITVVNKPLLQTDTVNLTLDKKYFMSESVISPPIVKNTSIDDNSNILRGREQTLESVLNTTLPTNKSNSISSLKDNSDLLIDPQLSISNNDKADISKEKGISNIHVFVDEVISTGTANTPDNNKTVQNYNTENKYLNDGELKSNTDSLTSVMSDELDIVHGVVPSIQITNADKTVVPLVEEFNINGTQTVISTSSPIDISAFQNKIPENITEIVNLTLDKNDFVSKSLPTKKSTINDTSLLRAREITVFESEPSTTPLTNDIHVFGSLKDNNRNISIDQKPEFETENKYLNNRELKNNTERSTSVVSVVPTQAVNGVVPSIQITEIDKTSVPLVVQFNTSTIQNVPIATSNKVLAPNDNSVDNFATSFSLIAKPEIMHSNVVNDNNVESSSITNKQLIKETNSVHLIPTSIDLVPEPVALGTNIQTEYENMAFPLRIDQLNATFIPNVEITTVPIDYTDNVNQTDYVLKSEIVDPTTDTTSVLLAVELDSTNMRNVPHATPRALALTPRETSSFDIQANPNILTKAVTSERSVVTTKPVSIVPIEIDNVNVKKHVIPISNDYTSKFATKNSDISPNRGSSIITDIVEMNPTNTEAVLSTTPSLNQIAEIAYTNNLHAIADETITQKPILETLKNVLEKPIVPIGIGASEVFDTSLKINNNAEHNPKTNSINIFELDTNLEHSVPVKNEFVSEIVHPDIITNTEENVSSGIITVSAQDPLISPINIITDKVDNISQKPILSTEHFLIKANSIPSSESSVEDENVRGQPMLLVENKSQKMPVIANEVNEPIVVNLLSADDKTINNSMGGQNLLELKSTNENYSQNNLVSENSTDHLTSTQIFPPETLTTIGVPHTNPSTIDEVTKLETSYNEMVNNIPEKSQPENIAITATQPFTDVTSAMVNNIVATKDQVPELLTVVSNIVDNEKNKSSVLIEGKSIQTPIITDEITSSTAVNIQINTNNTDNTVLNAFSDIKIGELNVSGINNSQNNLVAENNNMYLVSTIKLTELSQTLPNTLSVKGRTDNVATTIVQESEPFIIKSDNGNGTINTVVLMDKIPKINNNMQHPFVEKKLPQQNTINENNSQNNLESGNNGDHVRPTISDFIAESNIVQKNSPLGVNFVPLGLKELNISDSQMTKPATTYNVDNISEKSTSSIEHFIITANSRPSTESTAVNKSMLLAENISTKLPVITNEVNESIILNLKSTADTINNGMSDQNLSELKSTNENYSQNNLVSENSTDRLTSTQIYPSETLTTIGVPHTDPSPIDEVTKLETSYNEMVNNIPEKSQPENIAITATQPFTDVTSAMVNNIVATMDQVSELLTVVSNIVDNEKNKSSVLIEGTLIQAPAITDEVNSSTAINIQINTNNTENTDLNGFSDINLGELNVSGINNSQNDLVAENNNTYLISTLKLTELSQSMPNTLSVKGNTDNVATSILQESEPFIIKSDNGNGTINTAVLIDKIPKINKNMQHPFVEQNLPQQNTINENNSQNNLESGNNGDHVRPTISDFIAESNIVQKNSPLGINFVPLRLKELNISDSQMTKPATTYNVDNTSEKSTSSMEHFLITANSRPSTESTVVDKSMLLAENISKKVPVATNEVNEPIILNLQSTADTINNGMSDQNLSELKSTNENYSQKNLVPENSMDHSTSTQIFPSETLTTIGVPYTDPSTIDEVTKLKTSYNEMVNNIPEKSQPENTVITASTQPFTDVASAIVNNIVATMDQVPELLTVVSNIVDNEKNKSPVLIEDTLIQAPVITDEVNSSTAVNIQINTNNTDNTDLNGFSDINLGEINVSGINNNRNHLVAENNNTYLISTIKLTELSQSMPKGRTDNVATTIVQESEPFIIKTDTGNGTINTVVLMDTFPKINNNMQHPFAEQNTNNGQNDLESGNSGDHVRTTMNDFISQFKIVQNHSQSALGTHSVPLRLEDFLWDSMLNHTVVNLSSDNPQSVLINVVPGNVSIITDNVTTLADQFSLPVTAHLDKVDNGTVTSVLQTEKSNYANFATPVEMYNSIEKSTNSFVGQNINGENHKPSDLVLDTKKLDLLTMDSKKLSGTDLDVDNVNSFIDNAFTAIHHDNTQNILNKPLSTDASNTNEPIATERSPIQAPDTTTIQKISQFNCTTSGTNDVGITDAPTDKTFTESGKITNIATSAITSQDNIPSDLIDGNAINSQPVQIAATGSPKLLTISTNYDTTSTTSTGQYLDIDTTNNKPTEIQNTKTVVNNPIADITTEVKIKNNSIGSNNSGSSLGVNTTPLPPKTSFISLPTITGNVAAVPTDNVQEFITIYTPTDLIDGENKTIVSVKQLHNLDSVNFGSNSNADTWKSTGQIIVQSNINTPTSIVAENSTSNNLNNLQNENTFGNELAQTTLTKAISSHYNLGAINNQKTGTDDVKTTNPSLTDNPEIVNIQKGTTPDYIIKTTIQNLDTLKQLNTPSAVTVIENSFVPSTVETLTKHLIQNKMDSIISDQKLISVEQNSDKGIPTVNPTTSIHDSNTDEKIKIVSTYNTVNSQNTMPTATLQLSSPSISNYYVEDTSQTQSPSVSVTTSDFGSKKTSIKEYIKNLVKRFHIVPAVETKQSTSNILSTSGLNTTSNRDITFTTTLLSNSFDRENLTQPYYITKKIVNDGTPNNVFTINSKNIPYYLMTDQLQSGFTSGSTLPADSLSKVVVYGQNTSAKSLISESPVLTTKVNNIPKIVLDRMKQFSTLNPFVTSGSGPIQRFVFNSNTHVPQLVNLIKSRLSSPQYVISNVNKDPLVITDSNIESIIKSPKSDSRLETIIFTKEKASEPYVVSKISKGFRRSYDDSKDDNNVTSVQNVDSEKKIIGPISNNNTQDTYDTQDANSIKLVDMNGADTVNYHLENDGKGSKDNVESAKIEEKEATEKISISKDSNKPLDFQLRPKIGIKYSPGAIESVTPQGNSQTEALMHNLANKTDNGSVNIAKRNSTINDNLVDLTSNHNMVTKYVQSYLNKDGKQGNKTSDELRLNESSMRRANSANVQLNASSIVKSTGTESPPAFNCTARGRYADKKDCRKFYTCIGNLQPIMGTCPNNTVFSEINKQCTRNLSHCVRNNQFRCLLEGRFSDFFKDNIYYICVKNCTNHFTRYKLQCQDGYHLNKGLVKCERDEEVSTQSASSVSEVSNDESTTPKTKSEKIKTFDDFECEKEGNFPYAKDCLKYYTCTKVKDVYRRKIKKCSKDEVYDKKKKMCVDSDSIEC